MANWFKVDGVEYPSFSVYDLKINGEFLYEFAERLENGNLITSGIGFYENPSFKLKSKNELEFENLYKVLSNKKDDNTFNVTLTIPTPSGLRTFKVYVSELSPNIIRLKEDGTIKIYGVLEIKCISIEPRGNI